MPDCCRKCCTLPPDKYSGPDCVEAEISGMGAKNDCSKAQIFMPNITKDPTINGYFGAENVKKKLDDFNELSKKKCNPFWAACVSIPFVAVGIVLFTLIRGNAYFCTGSKQVCDVFSNTTSNCNALWCCEDWPTAEGTTDDSIKTFYDDQSFDYASHGCERVAGNESMMLEEQKFLTPDSWYITFEEGCASGEPVKGCSCTVSYDKNGAKRDCQPLFMQGNPDNFDVQVSNFAVYFSVAMVCVQMAWIIPAGAMCSATKNLKKMAAEHFKDWIEQGLLEVKLIEPKQKKPGRIVFVFPEGTRDKFKNTEENKEENEEEEGGKNIIGVIGGSVELVASDNIPAVAVNNALIQQ